MPQHTITTEQWNSLNVGDILISPTGRERKILEKQDNLVLFTPLISNRGKKKTHVAVLKTDIWNSYKIKNSKELRNGNTQSSVEFCALQFIRAVILENPSALLSSEYILAEFTKYLRQCLN